MDECIVDIPFKHRHQCWFCGEPRYRYTLFPHPNHIVLDCSHPQLALPTCQECHQLAVMQKVDSVWQLQSAVKQALINKYRKDLAIGVNWTEEELANSGFEDGNFAGFQRSAWFMYQVACQRVNFVGWTLSLDGITLDEEVEQLSFTFDGVQYPNIDSAIRHYAQIFGLPVELLKQTLYKIGNDRFADAVRFCRLQAGKTPREKSLALAILS